MCMSWIFFLCKILVVIENDNKMKKYQDSIEKWLAIFLSYCKFKIYNMTFYTNVNKPLMIA